MGIFLDKLKNNEFNFMLEIELSSKCQALCPMCARIDYNTGNLTSELELQDLDFFKCFESEENLNFLKSLKSINFCGAVGDPFSHKQLPEILEFIYEHNPECRILFDTNGSLGSIKFWEKVCIQLAKFKRHQLNFGVDGASNETEKLYRINCSFDRALERMKLARKFNIRCKWQFIVFKHNEHEVDRAFAIAKFLDIPFEIRKTSRFKKSNKFPVMKNGEIQYYLEPPTDERYIHPGLKKIQKFRNNEISKIALGEQKIDTEIIITCQSYTSFGMFLSSSGQLLPCCFVRTALNGREYYKEQEFLINPSLSMYNNTIYNIFENDQYIELEKNWQTENRMLSCHKFCGKSSSKVVREKIKN